MTILLVLLPLGILFLSVAVVLFVWAVRSDQFDDLDLQGERILFDDESEPTTKSGDSQPRSGETPL